MFAQSDPIQKYYDLITLKIKEALEKEKEKIIEVAELWSQLIKEDKLLYVFGSGHSQYIAGELHWRAGGLAPVLMIEDPSGGKAERVEGYARTFISPYNIEEGDMVMIISNSGINPSPIEVALYAKEKGAITVALCSIEHSNSIDARHSSGKKLHDICDYVLDNHGVPGDSIYPLSRFGWNICPTSTIVGSVLLNALVAQTCENLIACGLEPPVLLSANIKEGDIHNRKLADKYWNRLTKFPRLGSK